MLADNILKFRKKDDRKLRVLIAEDDVLERHLLIEQIKPLGHEILCVENGQQAIGILEETQGDIDIILMDRIMPVMDGMSAAHHIRQHPLFSRIPIIMITGASSAKDIQEGIQAGVFYYMAKPFDEGILGSVIESASRESSYNKNLNEEIFRYQKSFQMMESCKCRFSTLEEAESLAPFLANCFPNPQRVFAGIAGLLLNAVEHGLYKIGYGKKTDLIETGTLRAEILRRQASPEYQGRHAEAVMMRKDNGVYLIVTDDGDGFQWKRYLTIEPARAKDHHGRGIAHAAALSFDKLTYNEKGNQAVAFVMAAQDLEW
ncbi:MAG: response regulator [Micavibrio sp.]